MKRESIGRCNILISVTGLLTIAMWALPLLAAPVAVDVEAALDVAEGGWSDIVADAERSLPLDEQIFTEISPIVATEDGVRLPEDQSD